MGQNELLQNDAQCKVLLIGGHRKSGTTMLTRLFDGHSQIAVSPTDINVLYAYYPQWTSQQYTLEEKLQRLNKVVIEPFRKALKNDDYSKDFVVEEYTRELNKQFARIDTSEIYQVVSAIANAHHKTQKAKKEWLVLKETTSEVYAPDLLTINPTWKFLHLVRDPRDNYAAIKAGYDKKYSKLGNDYIDTLGSLLIRYAYGVKWLRWNLKQFGLNRYYLMRFEDLTYNTAAQMRQFANWLGISWCETLLTPTLGGSIFEGNSHNGIKFSGVDSRNVGKWTERIGSDEAALVEYILQDEMDWLGYKRETEEATGAKVAAEFYAKMNYKYFFGDAF